ncbi:hypothetical protein D3C74_75530 [compost metagenome]
MKRDMQSATKSKRELLSMKAYIRYPLNMKLIVSMLILAVLCMFNVATSSNSAYKILFLAFIMICLLIIITAVARRFLKPRLLLLHNEVLNINHNQIEANDIRRIYIQGDCLIGIKPRKNRIVPVALCFEFCNTNAEIDTLIEWAKNNNIEVSHTTFFKWI